MRNKILFFSPSPRDIPEVKQPIVDILYPNFDVIWFKYFPELEAYQKARKYFLESPKQYDYLAVIPDDLAINQKGINNLLRELENPTIDLILYNGNYPALAGICNYSYVNEEQMNLIPASINSTTSTYLLRFDMLDTIPDNVIKVAYSGFAVQFIHRSVLEQIDFKRYPDLGLDNSFADSLVKKKIPQYILKTARFTHFKGLSVKFRSALSVNPDVIYQGIYKPHIIMHDIDDNIIKK